MLDWDTLALLDGLDERRIGGRVLDWETVALLDGRQLDDCRIGGRESVGVAGRDTAG